jgi:hypothetical protein
LAASTRRLWPPASHEGLTGRLLKTGPSSALCHVFLAEFAPIEPWTDARFGRSSVKSQAPGPGFLLTESTQTARN